MKKTAFLIVLIAALTALCAFPFTPSAFAAHAEEAPSSAVLHDGTPLFENAGSESLILLVLNQGAELSPITNSEITAGGIVFIKVKFGGYIGYIYKDSIYEIIPPLKFSAVHVKIRSEKFGKPCAVFLAPDAESEVSFYIKDSQKAEKLLVTSGGYTLIKSEGKTGYIENKYVIEKGLTQNERAALIIGCVGFVFLLAILLLLGYSKNIFKNRKRHF